MSRSKYDETKMSVGGWRRGRYLSGTSLPEDFDALSGALSRILPSHCLEWWPDEGILAIRPSRRMYSKWELTFETLRQIADAAGSKDINLSYDSGWAGTELTPGDPARFGVFIRNPLGKTGSKS